VYSGLVISGSGCNAMVTGSRSADPGTRFAGPAPSDAVPGTPMPPPASAFRAAGIPVYAAGPTFALPEVRFAVAEVSLTPPAIHI